MFTEREALRLRLEQLNDAEIQVIREIQRERNGIYVKLRELDKFDASPENYKKKSLIELAHSTAQALKKQEKVNRPGPYKSKTATQREAALEILKRYEKGLSGVMLKNEIQYETGLVINNMTTFMQGLMKNHPEVKKPYRGRYVLDTHKVEVKSF
ncbi:hypothetical protein LG208_00050 [Bacillus paralicheniformis]|uniref:Rok-like winged helix domain-containing protein n=1 Tax=Bacillus paralicheniformis TaxID=1648923 RepID=UPI000C783336|nr:hypothetical protein [Bacillus paralicheniformis]MCY1628288.1 hypothetical protein [Bacillus paralicheniformis]PLC14017.1 hypothetical protein BV582_20815 [Bacillus paralicheniformis]